MLHNDHTQILFQPYNQDNDIEFILIDDLIHFFNNCFNKLITIIFHFVNNLLNNKQNVKISKPTDIFTLSKNYIDKETVLFNSFVCKGDYCSQNCDEEIFDVNKYNEIMKKEHNFLEEKWKTKILMENTPRGNVIMFYDAYKKCFSFYSDQASLPYNILNTIAMKYVRIFLCLNFFIDDSVIDKKTKMILLLEQEEEKEREKGKEKEKEREKNIHKNIGKNIFLQPKNKRIENTTTTTTTNKNSIESNGKGKGKEKETQHRYNHFSYQGKLINFSFLKKKIIKKEVFNTTFDTIFDNNHNLQQKTMSYKDFKHLR